MIHYSSCTRSDNMDFLRQIVRRLRRTLKRDKTPAWVYQEIEKRQNKAALKQFLARRKAVSSPSEEPRLQKVQNVDANRSTWKVKLLNIYPDLTEFK